MATKSRGESVWHRVRTLFWNATEGRLRALWRVLGALAVVLGLGSAGALAVGRSLPSQYLGSLAAQVVYAGVAAVLLVALARYIDRRPLAAYGLRLDRTWGRDLAVGVAIGVVGWGGALATSLLFGWASVERLLSAGTVGFPLAVGLAIGVAQYALVGFWEEVVFRGVVLRNAVEGLGWLPRRRALAGGLGLSSLLFGVLHADQAGSPLALSFWVLAGLVMGLAYVWTDSLALPISLHAAFDVSVNHVWGLFAVRVGELPFEPPTLVRPAFTGPESLVAVAGPINTGWLLVIGVAVVAFARLRNGSFAAPFRTEYEGR
jgi:membrane protease YdiL (CAAX protease family)